MGKLRPIWRLYYEDFRDLSPLGRTLWILVLVKLFIIFAVLRAIFFRPAMADCRTDEEKARTVIENLTN